MALFAIVQKKIQKMTVWDMSILKTTLLLLGMIIGALISGFVKQYLLVFIVLFLVGYVAVMVRFWRR